MPQIDDDDLDDHPSHMDIDMSDTTTPDELHIDTRTPHERCEEAELRVDHIIWLPGCGTGAGEMSAATELILSDLDRVLVEMPALQRWITDRGLDVSDDEQVMDGLSDWIRAQGITGWLVQVATPAMTLSGDQMQWRTYSWSHYSTNWIYADTWDAVLVAAHCWVDSQRAGERKRAWMARDRKAAAAAAALAATERTGISTAVVDTATDEQPQRCTRIQSDGKPCGLTPPCPDCGRCLVDVPEGA